MVVVNYPYKSRKSWCGVDRIRINVCAVKFLIISTGAPRKPANKKYKNKKTGIPITKYLIWYQVLQCVSPGSI